MGAAQRQHPQGLKPEAGIAAGQKIRLAIERSPTVTSSAVEPYPKPEGPFGLIIANSDMAISSCNAPTHRPRRCLVLRMDGETNGTLLHCRLILQGWSQQGWAGPDRDHGGE